MVVPRNDDGSADPARIAEAIDDRTALVAVSHVLFRSSSSSTRAPSSRRRAASAPRWCSTSIRPPASSLSTSTALGVDFAAGGCLKWLCGGPGNAFLYTRPDRLSAVAAALDRMGRRIRSRSPSTSTTTSRPPTSGACRRGRRRSRRTTPRCPGCGCLEPSASTRSARRPLELTRRLLALVSTSHGFRTVASRDPDAAGRHRGRRRARRARRRPHPQRPRHRRRLPPGGRHPRGASRLQHRRGGRCARSTAMADIVRTKDYVPATRDSRQSSPRRHGQAGGTAKPAVSPPPRPRLHTRRPREIRSFCNSRSARPYRRVRAIPTQTVRLCRLGTRLVTKLITQRELADYDAT